MQPKAGKRETEGTESDCISMNTMAAPQISRVLESQWSGKEINK